MAPAVERQQGAGENVALRRAAMREDRLAGAFHMWRVNVVARHLQREIGFDAGAHVERTFVEERPAAMPSLDAAQIVAELRFELQVRRLAEEVHKENIFGGDGAIGLKLEDEMAVGLLRGEQRLGGARDAVVQRGKTRRAREIVSSSKF